MAKGCTALTAELCAGPCHAWTATIPSWLQGDGSTIPGLSEALAGMREGGKRRCLIPPSVGYAGGRSELAPQMPTFATKRQLLNHSNEPLLFEIQLLKVR